MNMSDKWYDEDDIEDVVEFETQELLRVLGFWFEDRYESSYQLIAEDEEVILCKLPNDLDIPTSIVPISLLMFSKLKRHSVW